MRQILSILAISGIVSATQALTSWPSVVPQAGQAIRVAGSSEPAVFNGTNWSSGAFFIEAPLPVGYTAPTPVGCIEIKTYPTVRRAEVSGDDFWLMGEERAFWRLFGHI